MYRIAADGMVMSVSTPVRNRREAIVHLGGGTVNAYVSRISGATLRLVGLAGTDDDAADLPLETAAAPRRPTDGAALVFAAPLGTAVLLHAARNPIQDVLRDGFVGLLLVGLALTLMAGQCVLAVRAGVLALRGREQGVDLASSAMLLSLAACVLLFVAGVRLDYPGWGMGVLAALVIGMFRLDSAGANAWYARVTERIERAERVQPVERIERVPVAA